MVSSGAGELQGSSCLDRGGRAGRLPSPSWGVPRWWGSQRRDLKGVAQDQQQMSEIPGVRAVRLLLARVPVRCWVLGGWGGDRQVWI